MTDETSLGIHITQNGDIVFTNGDDTFTIEFTTELAGKLAIHLFSIGKIFTTRLEAEAAQILQDLEPAGAA